MDLPPAPTPPGDGRGVGEDSIHTSSDRTSNLLNLLKFSDSGTSKSQQQPLAQSSTEPVEHFLRQTSSSSHDPGHLREPQGDEERQFGPHAREQLYRSSSSLSVGDFSNRIHQPAPAGADPSGLLAALMRGTQDPAEQKKPNSFGGDVPSADTTTYLLSLLNRPKPSQTEQPVLTQSSRSNDMTPQTTNPPMDRNQKYAQYSHHPSSGSYDSQGQHHISHHIYGRQQCADSEPYSEPKTQGPTEFTTLYQQLIGSLAQNSPQSQGALAHSPTLKTNQASSTGSQRPETSQTSLHVKRAHSFRGSEKKRETVSEAVSEIADQADRDAQRALARAEHQDITLTLPSVETQSKDVEEIPTVEAEKSCTEERLNANIYPKVQNLVVDDQVADSWESADQEEIVVIEERDPPPIKVYNFPMEPWISISLREGNIDTRPEFREDSIMDIARLKKEFDQMDRNLYTASQTYMAYGMSKQGGLRVIRQDDGKDAKVFTDTKDRVFNMTMSVSSSENGDIPREIIIGTGISGTVYWVQVKDGKRDHIDDPHMEQYGFALPPVSSQEGDAPGGILKTRARASTSRPEFFAVGRGKSINLIWPFYVLQNNLFKPGHDRVVDTERLLKECSLQINTGKAGKDFTFSQDNTVIVSLDKAGRVKFWDIRDMTAAREDSDPRAPLPAQTSLEVKEPLMTLVSTPEGDKPWPTSVLLLDKQRPYQKQCALRYMIVGMKQNHTLQLWDLALRKPVQEFNLPHSKESDAVCSVMYHPATGMIVIGHPTRNSVYFAHLSAPKYNLKSVSQADYIQRLVAQDSSIPQPANTAVISGVREYSISRGDLRSLDILSSPAMMQDTNEPTLFELYAMHSKGVACILIKQAELGWSKDNKVLAAVNAVSEGMVTVSKLKSPQVPEISTGTSTRGAIKDSLQISSTQTDISQRSTEFTTPARVTNESKNIDPPSQFIPKENQGDKSERKSRKKKAASMNPSDASQNGTTNKVEGSKAAVNGAADGLSHRVFEAAIAGMESRLCAGLADSMNSSLKTLHGKMEEGARIRDENFNQHQLKLLDMVSEVLNENIQKVLESLIHQQFTDLVIPAIGDKAGTAIEDLLRDRLGPHISSSVQTEVQHTLPLALSRALHNGDFTKAISERMEQTVSACIQQNLSAVTQQFTAAFSNLASQSVQRVAGEIHQQYQDQVERMMVQHAADSNKIDQLLSYVSRLTDMVSTMAASQSQQAEFAKFKQPPGQVLPGQSGSRSEDSYREPRSMTWCHHAASSHLDSSHQGSLQAGQAHVHAQHHLGSPHHPALTHMSPSVSAASVFEHAVPPSYLGTTFSATATNSRNRDEAGQETDLFQRLRAIEQAIHEERYQEAMIQWIQSGRQEEIFCKCLSHYSPSKFNKLPPIMLLVVMATIAKTLHPNPRLKEEIDWIEMAVRAFIESIPTFVSLPEVDLRIIMELITRHAGLGKGRSETKHYADCTASN